MVGVSRVAIRRKIIEVAASEMRVFLPSVVIGGHFFHFFIRVVWGADSPCLVSCAIGGACVIFRSTRSRLLIMLIISSSAPQRFLAGVFSSRV